VFDDPQVRQHTAYAVCKDLCKPIYVYLIMEAIAHQSGIAQTTNTSVSTRYRHILMAQQIQG
jgi:hypothetical protein